MKVSQDQFILAILGLGLFFYWLFHRDRVRTLQDETSRLGLRLKPAKANTVATLDTYTKMAKELSEGKSRALNVFFNFNGHTFEAYEILGLPGGASLEQVQQAYQKMRPQPGAIGKTEKDLIDVAFEVLVKELQSTKN